MKIKGRTIQGPAVEVLVLPRGGPDKDIVFKCEAVLDYTAFEALVPEPVPPTISKPGQPDQVDVEDKDYLDAVKKRSYKRFAWMILKSLQATEGLEFDNVKTNDPESWEKLDDELKAAGITPAEQNHIYKSVLIANGLNDERMKEARDRFFKSEGQMVPH